MAPNKPHRPNSDPTPNSNSARSSRTPPRSSRAPSRSNHSPTSQLTRYLEENDSFQAFLNYDPQSTCSRSQMPPRSGGFVRPQAPPYQSNSEPGQASSRDRGGSSTRTLEPAQYQNLDDRRSAQQYATPYARQTPTHYARSQSGQAPPPYDSSSVSRSFGQSMTSDGMLDNPFTPPEYDVSTRSQAVSQYPYQWESEWEHMQGTRNSGNGNRQGQFRGAR